MLADVIEVVKLYFVNGLDCWGCKADVRTRVDGVMSARRTMTRSVAAQEPRKSRFIAQKTRDGAEYLASLGMTRGAVRLAWCWSVKLHPNPHPLKAEGAAPSEIELKAGEN